MFYRAINEPQVSGSDGRPKRNKVFYNYLFSDGDTVMLDQADENEFVVSALRGCARVFSCLRMCSRVCHIPLCRVQW